LVAPSGGWTDNVGAPFRTLNQALLLGLPGAVDAALRFPGAAYNSLIDAGTAAATSLGMDPSSAARLGRDLKGMPGAFIGSPRAMLPIRPSPVPPVSIELTGQWHQGISNPIHKGLQIHPNLRGLYAARDERFVTQAKDLQSHVGYQTWHRELDHEIAGHVMNNLDLTSQQFETYLRQRYQQPDLISRFPNGF
jgi:hypothetical protein